MSEEHELNDDFDDRFDVDDSFEDEDALVGYDGRQAAVCAKTGRTYSNDEVRKIERDNLALLGRLDEINRKSSSIAKETKRKPVKHVAASAINRKKQHQQLHQDNLAFLKRLENVKSTMTGKSGRSKAKAKPGPPRRKTNSGKLVQPEWKD
eukprot:TRINITY_DN12044_c0_g1_i1.p10 TRINITY_DN12044_c0_g1~~TRINITY_DN12044_c0_g1_i1.p10  ORF type:complete len:151 (+),score=27.53 TRINITY_DN12044_c0_g1_i1:2525-2977(+)